MGAVGIGGWAANSTSLEVIRRAGRPQRGSRPSFPCVRSRGRARAMACSKQLTCSASRRPSPGLQAGAVWA